jgi:hypothetical protein
MKHCKLVSLLAISIAAGCADVATIAPPSLTVDGPSSLAIGATVTLTVSTAHGKDASYTWTSATPSVATVDANGTVTAIALGEADIHVTGDQSKATSIHPIVVVASEDSTVPNYTAWSTSPHADASAEAFNHWNTEGKIPTSCARCHSTPGYVDYLGGDGTAAGVIDNPAPTGTVITCQACHTAIANTLGAVAFPSGTTITGLGPEARCMVCHQGRTSGPDVDTSITKASVSSDDTVSAQLGPTSIHYTPAAATLEGGRVQSGYQYAGQSYDVRFRHVAGYDTCVGCHDAHSTAVKVDECSTCHTAVTNFSSLHDIRMIDSFNQDYDGDGNRTEGMADEVQGVETLLLTAMQRYGSEHGAKLCFSATYPNWFIDGDGSGVCETVETAQSNAYASWTPRLVRAAYNYQFIQNDPGAYAHNAKYAIQLLHDTLADVNSALVNTIDLSALVRNDPGHFDGSALPAREWDDTGAGVPATCSRCHSGSPGFRFFTQYGVGKVVAETDNGLDCATCHDSFAPDFRIYVPVNVYLPNAATTTFDPTPNDGNPGSDNDDNLCANCHIGRQNGATIEAAIAAAPNGSVKSFQNVHYDIGAATRAGSALHVGSETPANSYAGPLQHTGGVECTTCHDPVLTNHTFAIDDAWSARCTICHGDADNARQIRPSTRTADYDGDGNTTESLADELDGMAVRALTAMRAYNTANNEPLVCYSISEFPYFFKDTNSSSPQCDASESVSANAYGPWPAPLLRAGHNYQISRKDPGAFAHNFSYVGELLYDSIVALGGDASGMTRP